MLFAVPKSLHAALASEADSECVNRNELVLAKLALQLTARRMSGSTVGSDTLKNAGNIFSIIGNVEDFELGTSLP